MKLMDRLLQMLSRGDGSTSPNEEVELAVVPIAAGPMTVASLRDSGIDAPRLRDVQRRYGPLE
jgi:hypothetical protein